MSISTEKPISEMINELADTVKTFIEKGKKEGSLRSQKKHTQMMVLEDFAYSDEGVKSNRSGSRIIIKDDWYDCYTLVRESVSRTNLYKQVEKKLESYSNINELLALEQFVGRLCDYCFPTENIDNSEIKKISNILIKEVNGEPLKSTTETELVGITLRSSRIAITNEVTLRQVTKSDLEFEMSYHLFDKARFGYPYPSAILNLELNLDAMGIVQRKERIAIAILRLFKVGGIRSIRSMINSERMGVLVGTTMYKDDKSAPLDTAIIKESDEESLKHFWKILESQIPLSFSDPNTKDTTFREIAYQRYTDALLKNGTIERRITNAMMGLESIFLRDGGELQELSYRLRLRIPRLMSQFGFAPFEVSRIINDAYKVRSKFVHGGLLTYNTKEKLNEKYGDIKKLLLHLLDYLRITIVITLLMNASKDELVNMIDKSFLDKKFEEEIVRIVRPAINAINLN